MSVRKEVIGLATLYCGDCREIAPTLERTTATITDPPYGIGADTHAGKKENGWRQYNSNGWDSDRPSVEFIKWISSSADYVCLWGGNYFSDILPASMGWLVWDKGQSDFSLADCELAWTNRKQALRRLLLPRASMISDGGQHPTQKPIGLMRFTIDKMKIPAGCTILDPYMGSGSTGVAAVQMRHPFTGIEIDLGYFDIACRRIEQAQRQYDMFRDAP